MEAVLKFNTSEPDEARALLCAIYGQELAVILYRVLEALGEDQVNEEPLDAQRLMNFIEEKLEDSGILLGSLMPE